MKRLMVDARPVIIVLQEMDHMADAQRDLAQYGYVCGKPGKVYRPAHETMKDGGKARDPVSYFAYLEAAGVAFVPKTNSNCRKFAQRDHPGGHADDDGVAVFWMEHAFEAVRIDFLAFDDPKRNQGAVRVVLRRRADGTEFAVIGTHLSSGSAEKDEDARMKEVQPCAPRKPVCSPACSPPCIPAVCHPGHAAHPA